MSTKLQKKPTVYQEKVEDSHVMRYRGPHKNCDEKFARDVITLYLTCKLGYAPIRRILGKKSERKISDIIRQHGFGRKNLKASDNSDTELNCPSSKHISELDCKIIKSIASDYGTLNDPYIQEMFRTGTWGDEHRTKVWKCKCGQVWEEGWIFCPHCARRRNPTKNKTLLNIDNYEKETKE